MRTFRLGVWFLKPVGLAGLVGHSVACFDSDERASQPGGTGSTGSTTTSVGTTEPGTSTGLGATTEDPDITCRDAVACIRGCANELINQVEPDLSCFLECEEALTVPEAVKLLRLINCAGDRCEMIGECAAPTGSSTSGSSTGGSSTGDGSSSSGSSTGGDEDAACITCIFATVDDPAPPGCMELADACQ